MSAEAGFLSALRDPEAPCPTGLSDGRGAPAGRRFDVYRNNVAQSLTEALETGFPVLARLIGPSRFRALAADFRRAHPPTAPLMMHYGAEMPAFLEQCAPLAHLGYLPDVARLELALRASYHAADHVALAPEALTDTARLALAPSARLIRSRWPLHAIWRYNTEEGAPKPPREAQDVLILRADFDPVPHLLGKGDAEFLLALGHTTLAEAAAHGAEAMPGHDLTALLTLLLSEKALIHDPRT